MATTRERPPELSERAKRALMRATSREGELSSRDLGDAILLDPDCEAMRALRSLGVGGLPWVQEPQSAGTVYRQPGGAVGARNLFHRYSDEVVHAMNAAAAKVRGSRIGTGDLLAGLLEADAEWVRRLGLGADQLRAGLASVDSDELASPQRRGSEQAAT